MTDVPADRLVAHVLAALNEQMAQTLRLQVALQVSQEGEQELMSHLEALQNTVDELRSQRVSEPLRMSIESWSKSDEQDLNAAIERHPAGNKRVVEEEDE